VRVPRSGETTWWMPHSGENASVRMRQDSEGSRILGNIQLAHKYAMMRRRLACIGAVTASGFAIAVSATTLRVQEFDKERGPVGLPSIGQACDLPAWPDQAPREGSLVKFWTGHQPAAGYC
jgi:hypothetical protein